MNISVEEMQQRLAREMGTPSRLGHTALLVLTVSMAAMIASLWLTEPALPPRTQAAFAALVAINLGWAALAGWVLARRRVLYAHHRVVSARLALVITVVVLLGAILVRERVGVAGVVTGATFVGIAAVVLVRAQQQFAWLQTRRRELEQRAN